MSLNQLSVFNVLHSTLGMLGERQKLLAENIANSDTPGFTPRDIDEAGFEQALSAAIRGGKGRRGLSMQVTDSGHFSAPGSKISANNRGPLARIIDVPGSETTLNGNSVVLEEQVTALADTRMRYDAAIGLYQKSISLMRLSIKAPGT